MSKGVLKLIFLSLFLISTAFAWEYDDGYLESNGVVGLTSESSHNNDSGNNFGFPNRWEQPRPTINLGLLSFGDKKEDREWVEMVQRGPGYFDFQTEFTEVTYFGDFSSQEGRDEFWLGKDWIGFKRHWIPQLGTNEFIRYTTAAIHLNNDGEVRLDDFLKTQFQSTGQLIKEKDHQQGNRPVSYTLEGFLDQESAEKNRVRQEEFRAKLADSLIDVPLDYLVDQQSRNRDKEKGQEETRLMRNSLTTYSLESTIDEKFRPEQERKDREEEKRMAESLIDMPPEYINDEGSTKEDSYLAQMEQHLKDGPYSVRNSGKKDSQRVEPEAALGTVGRGGGGGGNNGGIQKRSKVQKETIKQNIGNKFTKTTDIRPGNDPGQSRAEYTRIKNMEGQTIRTYKDSFDRSGKFIHRKSLSGGPEGRK